MADSEQLTSNRKGEDRVDYSVNRIILSVSLIDQP